MATGVGTAVGAAVGGSSGAFAGYNVDRFNRQLHPDERKAIADKANGDKAAQDRLTKAACYAVQCWAQFPIGSDEYNASFVSQGGRSQKSSATISESVDFQLFGHCLLRRIPSEGLTRPAVEQFGNVV